MWAHNDNNNIQLEHNYNYNNDDAVVDAADHVVVYDDKIW